MDDGARFSSISSELLNYECLICCTFIKSEPLRTDEGVECRLERITDVCLVHHYFSTDAWQIRELTYSACHRVQNQYLHNRTC